jgi:predicted lipoprotein with Yx(FWY)xxD motif
MNQRRHWSSEGGGQHRWSSVTGAGALTGAGLLAASAGIHLDLYLTGYRTIPTIGWLFLLQVVAGLALAVALAATLSRLAALAGAVFAAATLGGYLLSMWVGLFGFREVRTTAGEVAAGLEIAALAVLGLVATFGPARASVDRERPFLATMAGTVVAMVAAAGVLVGAAEAGSAGVAPKTVGAPRGHVLLGVRRIGHLQVLTNPKGFTLYWFALDSPSRSRCYGACAAYWPPLLGTPVAGPGVRGRLGTIRRRGGALQATYDGHPLYTYLADGAPGRDRGNHVVLNGGEWYAVVVASR